jgi:hypothetical protein
LNVYHGWTTTADQPDALNMPYKVSADLELGIVHLRYTGVVDLETRLKAREEVFQLCRTHNLSRSLVETQDSNIVMSVQDISRFGTSFKSIGLPQGYHVATVIAPGDEANALLEIVASIDGLNIKAFLSKEAALHWLTAF